MLDFRIQIFSTRGIDGNGLDRANRSPGARSERAERILFSFAEAVIKINSMCNAIDCSSSKGVEHGVLRKHRGFFVEKCLGGRCMDKRNAQGFIDRNGPNESIDPGCVCSRFVAEFLSLRAD